MVIFGKLWYPQTANAGVFGMSTTCQMCNYHEQEYSIIMALTVFMILYSLDRIAPYYKPEP